MEQLIFNINDYPGKYVMHCSTEEEEEIFRKYLSGIGRHWHSGANYLTKSYWYDYKGNFCFNFNVNEYCDLHFAHREGYKVLECSDFLGFTKKSLKSGDIILRRNGTVGIVILEVNVIIASSGFSSLTNYRDDLISKAGSEWDIIEVRRPTKESDCQFCAFRYDWGKLIYKRENSAIQFKPQKDNEIAFGQKDNEDKENSPIPQDISAFFI